MACNVRCDRLEVSAMGFGQTLWSEFWWESKRPAHSFFVRVSLLVRLSRKKKHKSMPGFGALPWVHSCATHAHRFFFRACLDNCQPTRSGKQAPRPSIPNSINGLRLEAALFVPMPCPLEAMGDAIPCKAEHFEL